MARYTGPVCRICRRAGEKLMLKGDRCYGPKCAIERRNQPPGQRSPRRRKVSDYGVQVKEKQKVRKSYGVLERQFRKMFREANRRPGATGDNLLRMLELRLDNVVFRLGIAESRAQARQLVRHGHITLNGKPRRHPLDRDQSRRQDRLDRARAQVQVLRDVPLLAGRTTKRRLAQHDRPAPTRRRNHRPPHTRRHRHAHRRERHRRVLLPLAPAPPRRPAKHTEEAHATVVLQHETPQIAIEQATTDYARVTAEPLARGFAHTLGNAIRPRAPLRHSRRRRHLRPHRPGPTRVFHHPRDEGGHHRVPAQPARASASARSPTVPPK